LADIHLEVKITVYGNEANTVIQTILVQSWTWRLPQEYYTIHHQAWNLWSISSINK